MKTIINITSIKKVANWDWSAYIKCIVCNLPIKKEHLSNALKCPHCNGIAHSDHLIEWIKMKGTCPYCRKRLGRSKLLNAI
ncbi:MAG: hypothetical protein EAX96_11655 [Candidatus Lokiarchaeota archaeon]|nr:hypothetical protein [Candidatus Lokiarchaeota archaeon]